MKVRMLALSMLTVAAASAPIAASAQAFLGGSVGRSRVDLDCSGSTLCDKTDTAFKVFGGYMFSRYFGVEATYYNQGKARLEGSDGELGNLVAEYKGRGYGVHALAAAPLGDAASLFVKLGAVSAKVTVDASASSVGGGSQSERHTHFAWGVGAAYAFAKQLDARLEWERVRVESMDEKRNADLFTIGLQYRF